MLDRFPDALCTLTSLSRGLHLGQDPKPRITASFLWGYQELPPPTLQSLLSGVIFPGQEAMGCLRTGFHFFPGTELENVSQPV